MPTWSAQKFWIVTVSLLIIIIAAGVSVTLSRYGQGQNIEIINPTATDSPRQVYVDGAVVNPGLYPVREGDTLETLIQVSGGLTDDADITQLTIRIPAAGQTDQPQKIDINRAESWLLEALPGIGEAKAQAIIDYRTQNGNFHSTADLLKVKGISTAVYEQVQSLITVAE